MSRVSLESLAGKDIARVYIAADTREAGHVESLLTSASIPYAAVTESYGRTILRLLPSVLQGVAFYVIRGQAGYCRTILREAGLTAGLVDVELS